MKVDLFEHINFLSGYMDAVGRSLTTDIDCFHLFVKHSESVNSITNDLNCKVELLHKVKDVHLDFEKALAELFEVDPRARLYFYLVEYVMWLEESIDINESQRVKLVSSNLPQTQQAWLINSTEGNYVLLYISRQPSA